MDRMKDRPSYRDAREHLKRGEPFWEAKRTFGLRSFALTSSNDIDGRKEDGSPCFEKIWLSIPKIEDEAGN